jgi:hypothetical protein
LRLRVERRVLVREEAEAEAEAEICFRISEHDDVCDRLGGDRDRCSLRVGR